MGRIHGEATEDQARDLTGEDIKIRRIPWLPRPDSKGAEAWRLAGRGRPPPRPPADQARGNR